MKSVTCILLNICGRYKSNDIYLCCCFLLRISLSQGQYLQPGAGGTQRLCTGAGGNQGILQGPYCRVMSDLKRGDRFLIWHFVYFSVCDNCIKSFWPWNIPVCQQQTDCVNCCSLLWRWNFQAKIPKVWIGFTMVYVLTDICMYLNIYKEL